MSNDCYVYILYRLTGEPCYVGKGTGNRINHHKEDKAKNPHLKNIMNLARGTPLPREKVLENLSSEGALKFERLLIAAIGREKYGGPLVNCTDGGDGTPGFQHKKEAKERIAAAHTGVVFTPERRMNISKALQGKNRTEESKENQRMTLASRSNEERAKTSDKLSKSKTGSTASDETKAKMSAASLGKQKSKAHCAAIKASWITRRQNANKQKAESRHPDL